VPVRSGVRKIARRTPNRPTNGAGREGSAGDAPASVCRSPRDGRAQPQSFANVLSCGGAAMLRRSAAVRANALPMRCRALQRRSTAFRTIGRRKYYALRIDRRFCSACLLRCIAGKLLASDAARLG